MTRKSPHSNSKTVRAGRKPLPVEQRRKTISVRVAADTYEYLIKKGLKAGREIDRLVRRELNEPIRSTPISSTMIMADSIDDSYGIDQFVAGDTVTEMARGLLAMIAERGTAHLTREQIEILDQNFTLIVNNFLATFKRNRDRLDI